MSNTALIRQASRPASSVESDQVTVPFWETAVVCVSLFLSTNALFPLVFGSNSDPTAPTNDPISHKAWLLIVLFVLVALVRFGRPIFAAIVRNPAITAICYLALISAIWSAVPGTTIKSSVELSFSTALGLYVGVRFGIARLVAMLSWTTALILVLSVVFALVLPKYGLDHERGDAWRGVFSTKNELGRMMVTGLVVWAVRTIAGETGRVLGVAMMLAFGVVGLESGSRTALGVTGLMLGVFLLVWLMSRRERDLVAIKGLVVSILALVGALCVTNVKLLLAVVGADYSLTGRTGIWDAVWRAIHVHAWLGYGLDAFWRGVKGPSYAVWRQAGTPVPHSHNGFLDLLLALGFVGLGVFVVAFIVVWRRGLAQLHTAEGSARTFPIVYLALLVVYNLTESSLVGARSLNWILFVAVAGALAGSPARVPFRRPARSPTQVGIWTPVAAEEP